MRRRRWMKAALAVGTVGLLILPALVYTQVTGRVLNPRLRKTYQSLSAAVIEAADNDTLLVSGTLTGSNAILDPATDTPPDGLKIVAGRGLRGTLQITALDCAGTTNGAILDVSDRQGSLLIQGLKLVVPNSCVGVLADATGGTGDGNPLTVRGVLFTGATATAVFTAIRTVDESGGPFIFRDNVITGQLDPGIELDGDGATAIEASIFRNKITNTGTGGSGSGIVISDIPAGSDVQVERNCINGGGSTNGIGTGIDLTNGDTNGVDIENNTIKNFAAATGVGFAMDDDDESVVFQKNVVQNNEVGIQVDFSGGAPTIPPTITLNNITGNPATQTGLEYTTAAGSPNLNATNNWWGAANGPRDDDPDIDCPEATNPPSCTTAPTTEGSGLPVAVPGAANDCGTTVEAETITTCPFRTSPVSGAGAGIGC